MAFRVREPGALLAGGGETTVPRGSVTTNALTLTSQTVIFCPFIAVRSEPITKVRMRVGGTAAATVTLIRVGIYQVDVSGNLVLIASIPNTTTMMGTINAASTTVNLSATWNKVIGRHYAAGVLVNASTPPTVWGGRNSFTSTTGVEPFSFLPYDGVLRRGTTITDLPASVTKAQLTAVVSGTAAPYVELLP